MSTSGMASRGARNHDRHERRAHAVGAVALLVLHHVADLMRGNRCGGDGAAVRGAVERFTMLWFGA